MSSRNLRWAAAGREEEFSALLQPLLDRARALSREELVSESLQRAAFHWLARDLESAASVYAIAILLVLEVLLGKEPQGEDSDPESEQTRSLTMAVLAPAMAVFERRPEDADALRALVERELESNAKGSVALLAGLLDEAWRLARERYQGIKQQPSS